MSRLSFLPRQKTITGMISFLFLKSLPSSKVGGCALLLHEHSTKDRFIPLYVEGRPGGRGVDYVKCVLLDGKMTGMFLMVDLGFSI